MKLRLALFKQSTWLKALWGIVMITVFMTIVVIFANLRFTKTATLSLSTFGQHAIFQQSTPTPTSLSIFLPLIFKSDQVTPTAAWQVYTDTDAGYSIKYPPNADVQEGKQAGEKYKIVDFNLSYKPYQGISVFVKSNPQNLSVKQFIDQEYSSLTRDTQSGVAAANLLYEPTQVNTVTSIKVSGMPSGHDFVVFVPSKDKIYQLSISMNPSSKTLKIFELMASTFQILR